MRSGLRPLIDALERAFPQRVAIGVIAPHDCEECSALRLRLAGRTWSEVSSSVAEDFCDALPLLSPDAYHAYLPVWLRAAAKNPDGAAAKMTAINVSSEINRDAFTQAQAHAVLAVVEWVATNNCWGIEDPVNAEHISAARAAWNDRLS